MPRKKHVAVFCQSNSYQHIVRIAWELVAGGARRCGVDLGAGMYVRPMTKNCANVLPGIFAV